MTKALVLSGTEGMLDGEKHFGIAVNMESGGKPSTLMIPDVTKVSEGAPVFITKPVVLELEKFKTFLQNKKIELPEPIAELLTDTSIGCNAFYFSNNGPQLMMFEISFKKGLIESLTGDADLGALFDITGASARYIKCTKADFETLKQYAAILAEE